MSKVDDLFAAEQELRRAARIFGDDRVRPKKMHIDDARQALRDAARRFADVAREIDLAGGGS
jgi:hypothetical protein